MKFLILVNFLYFTTCCTLRAQVKSTIDSAKKIINITTATDSTIIATSFFIADTYMDMNQYDSAQIWINKIHTILPIKANSISNYYLISRQAEVYYYNNLQQVGLQESKRGLAMAKALNDSFLLADSYNFLGLFYLNVDSTVASISNFEEGIRYLKKKPATSKYLSLTAPHHLYGNLSEAYFKQKNYEKALSAAQISYANALKINNVRGMAIAHMSIGDVFAAINNIDTAIYYYESALTFSNKNGDNDIVLLNNGNLANCFMYNSNSSKSSRYLQTGFSILQYNATINSFYALQFLKIAIKVYTITKNKEGLNTALLIKTKIDSNNLSNNNMQFQTIFQASLTNEKRLLNLELTDAQQKQKIANSRLIISLVLFCLLGIGFLVYRYYLNQKLALSAMRNKISQDLHDDIGASLSSLQVYSTVASQHLNNNPLKTKDLLQKITEQSTLLMDNISDIVWSMKLGSEQVISFDAKIKNYVSDIFAALNIEYVVQVDNNIDDYIKASNAKRNILMIVKEAVNNVVKYSKASHVHIAVNKLDNTILVVIKDDGIGFTLNKDIVKGNGFANIKKRIAELNGEATIESIPHLGTTIKAVIPIAAISNIGW